MAQITSTDRTLHLQHASDLLEKLRWEVGRAYELIQSQVDMKAAAYFSINAAVTAWHIGDWVRAEIQERGTWDLAGERLGTANEEQFDSWLRADPLLFSCHQIATAFKHRSLKEKSRMNGFQTVESPIEFFINEELHSITTFRVVFPGADIDLMALLHSVERWWQCTLLRLGMLPVELFTPDLNTTESDSGGIFNGW